MTTDATFPSITFPATFEGTAAIGADFSATLKLKTSNGPGVLADLKGLPRGSYDVTIVAQQARLDGDSIDREWANMDMQVDAQDRDDELVFDEHCLGGRCPHFAVATAGEFEGSYTCGEDPEKAFAVEHGVTPCPLGVSNADAAAFDAAAGELPGSDEDVPGDAEPLDDEMEHAEDEWPAEEGDDGGA